MGLYYEVHGENNLTVRVKKITLKNFKSIRNGEITLNCGRCFVPFNTEADILGIYGQNGSGKTSVIEALSIIKALMSGEEVPWPYSDCITVGQETTTISITFDLQYNNGLVRELSYSVDISTEDFSEEEKNKLGKEISELVTFMDLPDDVKRIIIKSERIELLWEQSKKRQMIIDTSTEAYPFTPDTKRKELIGSKKELLTEHKINKRNAYKASKSYVFMDETLALFRNRSKDSLFYQVLIGMRYYAERYLIVLENLNQGLITSNYYLPLFTRKEMKILDERHSEDYSEEYFDECNKEIQKISGVINALIPNLEIELKDLGKTMLDKGELGHRAMLIARRSGTEIPLYGESDGVRKIISMISMIVEVYNQQSTTLAIDEFDSGVFEYLLGEILQIIESSGKGQLIFTSHNLRPLEVINKKFIYFTSTNPDNRYIRLKNIGATNNLRDMYFREIVMNEQEEPIYNATKRFKIIAAFKKAGGK